MRRSVVGWRWYEVVKREKENGESDGLVVQTKDFGIPGRAASTRPLLKAQLHAHLLPRVFGAQFRAVHGKMGLTGRRRGRRRHGLLARGAGLRARFIGHRQRGGVAARAEQSTG